MGTESAIVESHASATSPAQTRPSQGGVSPGSSSSPRASAASATMRGATSSVMRALCSAWYRANPAEPTSAKRG